LLVKYNTSLQNNPKRDASDLLDRTIAMTPHLLDLEKCVPPEGNLFVLDIPFDTIIPLYSAKIYRSGMPSRGDILYEVTNELQVGDVSIVHPGAARYRRAANATPGAAAAQRDTEKQALYRQDEWGTYRCMPLSVETFGRLGTPMMRLLSDIGNLAVSSCESPFTKEQSVSGVLRELSASLCKINACLKHGVSGFFVRASGVCIRHGRSRPTAKVSEWD
jgi:hypothetical protein